MTTVAPWLVMAARSGDGRGEQAKRQLVGAAHLLGRIWLHICSCCFHPLSSYSDDGCGMGSFQHQQFMLQVEAGHCVKNI